VAKANETIEALRSSMVLELTKMSEKHQAELQLQQQQHLHLQHSSKPSPHAVMATPVPLPASTSVATTTTTTTTTTTATTQEANELEQISDFEESGSETTSVPRVGRARVEGHRTAKTAVLGKSKFGKGQFEAPPASKRQKVLCHIPYSLVTLSRCATGAL